MNYISIDYRKQYSNMVVKEVGGKVDRKVTVNNSEEESQWFSRPYLTGKAVLKATRNRGLTYNRLGEILDI